jgi:hypothetical protein
MYCLFNLVTFLVVFFLGGRIDEKAAQLHAITSLQTMLGKQQGSFAGGVNGNNSLTPQGPEVRQLISVRLWNFKDGGSLKASFLQCGDQVSRISFDFLKWRSTGPQKLTKMSL